MQRTEFTHTYENGEHADAGPWRFLLEYQADRRPIRIDYSVRHERADSHTLQFGISGYPALNAPTIDEVQSLVLSAFRSRRQGS